jgi:ammonia channel protein AmtB
MIHAGRTEVAMCCRNRVNAIGSFAQGARQPTAHLATEVPAYRACTWSGLQKSSVCGGNADGNAKYDIANQVIIQLKSAGSAAIYIEVATFVILKMVQLTIRTRVDGTAETRGLDLTEDEERGYIL